MISSVSTCYKKRHMKSGIYLEFHILSYNPWYQFNCPEASINLIKMENGKYQSEIKIKVCNCMNVIASITLSRWRWLQTFYWSQRIDRKKTKLHHNSLKWHQFKYNINASTSFSILLNIWYQRRKKSSIPELRKKKNIISWRQKMWCVNIIAVYSYIPSIALLSILPYCVCISL